MTGIATLLSSLLLNYPQVAHAGDSGVQKFCRLPQTGNGGDHGLKHFLVRAFLELTGNRGLHQNDSILEKRLPVGQQHSASIRQRGKLGQIVRRPKIRCFDEREGMFNFLYWISQNCRVLQRAGGIVCSHPQSSRGVNKSSCSYTRNNQFIVTPPPSISMCDTDCDENGRYRANCLNPGRPIRFAQVPADSQQSKNHHTSSSKGVCEGGSQKVVAHRSYHSGILA